MNNIWPVTLLLLLFSCASKKQEKIPPYTEIRIKSFSKNFVQIEAVKRKDVHCRSQTEEGELVDSCMTEGGNALFQKTQEARQYAKSKANFYCGDKTATIIRGAKSREVSGRAPLKCEDSFGLFPYPGLGFSEIECLGGEDVYNQVITIEYKCTE